MRAIVLLALICVVAAYPAWTHVAQIANVDNRVFGDTISIDFATYIGTSTPSNESGLLLVAIDDVASQLSVVIMHDIVGATAIKLYDFDSRDILMDITASLSTDTASVGVSTITMRGVMDLTTVPNAAQLVQKMRNNELIIFVEGASQKFWGSIIWSREIVAAYLDGIQEVPQHKTGYSGIFISYAISETNIFYKVFHNIPNDQLRGCHLHPGAVGLTGPVMLGLSQTCASPFESDADGITLPAINTTALYINLHTATYPDGEIRGQLGQLAASFMAAGPRSFSLASLVTSGDSSKALAMVDVYQAGGQFWAEYAFMHTSAGAVTAIHILRKGDNSGLLDIPLSSPRPAFLYFAGRQQMTADQYNSIWNQGDLLLSVDRTAASGAFQGDILFHRAGDTSLSAWVGVLKAGQVAAASRFAGLAMISIVNNVRTYSIVHNLPDDYVLSLGLFTGHPGFTSTDPAIYSAAFAANTTGVRTGFLTGELQDFNNAQDLDAGNVYASMTTLLNRVAPGELRGQLMPLSLGPLPENL